MKALVLHGPGDLRLEEVADPVPKGEWVRIRVKRVGICGTDKAFYKGTYRPFKLPLIPGHEIVGVVDMVGDAADEGLIGKRVTTEINVHCRRCWYCRSGMPTHCPYRQTIGISIDGGMAEYVLTRQDLLHSVDGLTDKQAAFVEPLAAVVEMTEMVPPSKGSRMAVIGIGTIGLLSIQVLRQYEPEVIVAFARPGSPKAGLAERLGADEVLSPRDAEYALEKYTPEGAGFDYVVEASGSNAGVDLAIRIVRPRGVIAAKSTHGSRVSLDYTALVVKEARVIGSRCGPFPKAIELLRKGIVRVDDLVSAEYRLEDGVKGFEKSFDRRVVKIHLLI